MLPAQTPKAVHIVAHEAILKIFICIIHVCVCKWHIYMGVHRNKKKASDLLEQDLAGNICYMMLALGTKLGSFGSVASFIMYYLMLYFKLAESEYMHF